MCRWIDFRPQEAFVAGHVPGSVRFDWPRLRQLQNALPPPHAGPLALMEPLDEAVAWLKAKGYAVQRHRWAAWSGPVERGDVRHRLWRPTPQLARWLDEAGIPPGQVLDLGCGGGRDAVWLALRGWQVTAIDREKRALARAQALAAHEGVSVDWRTCNLRADACLPAGPFDLMLMVRAHLPWLFPRMVARLKSGGHAFVLCFHPDAMPPRAATHKATPGQLCEAFAGLRPIAAKIVVSTDGRPMSLFIGRKP